LAAGELPARALSQAERVNARFIRAVERLEKRIGEMELMTAQRPPAALESHLPTSPATAAGANPIGEPIGSEEQPGAGALPAERGDASRVSLFWIGKGQALLNLGQTEEALGCFDEAVELDPGNAEAFVKRGMALEKLHRLEEALACYDRAIAADGSMTLAYLYKGAVCNRLQRFREALECYEKALKMEPKAVT